MLNPDRIAAYAGPGRDPGVVPGLTPKQVRRKNHKQFSRKTHEHLRDADGKKIRCPRCRPPGWANGETAVKAVPGPRDWSPA